MRVLIAAATAAALLTGCAGGAATATGRTIDIEMREFSFSPSTIRLAPGERVTFRLKNSGTVEHDFMAGRDPVVGKGYGRDWLATAKAEQDGAHDMGHAGEGARVAAKRSATMSVLVPAEKGEFEFGCFVPGHYETGMRGKLVVE